MKGPSPSGSGESVLEPSDVDLWKAAVHGDHAAFHALVDRHARSLFRVALSLSESRSDAEDICQETFAAAFKGLKGFDGRASVKTWLTRILMRRAAKIWNKQRNARHTISLHREDATERDQEINGIAMSGKSVASATTVDMDTRMDVLAVIRELPEEFRDVVVLREIDGLSYQEIADSLGVPRGTVESRLHRARAELRRKLTGY